MSEQDAAGSPESGDPAAAVPGPADPWAPPPPGWQPPSPPASPPPPYAAPPGWQPPAPPPYGAPSGWQPSGQPPPYGWSPQYTQPRNTNGFAIASLVCGIGGLVIPLLGGLLGIVFGIIGLSQTRNRGEGGRGLAIAGIVVGAVTIVLWVGLLAGVSTDSGGGSSTVSPLLTG